MALKKMGGLIVPSSPGTTLSYGFTSGSVPATFAQNTIQPTYFIHPSGTNTPGTYPVYNGILFSDYGQHFTSIRSFRDFSLQVNGGEVLVLLRIHPTTGDCMYLYKSTGDGRFSHEFSVGRCNISQINAAQAKWGINTTNGSTQAVYTFTTAVTGYVDKVDSTGDLTVQMQGHLLTVSCAGTTLVSKLPCYSVTQTAGTMWVLAKPNFATRTGLTTCNLTELPKASLYSSPETNWFSIKDAGYTGRKRQGSIAQNSNQFIITGADATLDYPVGAEVCIPVGGEAGAGNIGTVGVGGQYPNLVYANLAALQAVTGLVNGMIVGDLSTGKTYYFDQASNSYYTVDNRTAFTPNPEPPLDGNYYFDHIVPRALISTVTAVSFAAGNTTVTLADTARNSATAVDLVRCIDGFLNGFPPAGKTLSLPDGFWGIKGPITMSGLSFQLVGSGTNCVVYSPDGSPSIDFRFLASNNLIVRGVNFKGGFKDKGYGFLYFSQGYTYDPLYQTMWTDFPASLQSSVGVSNSSNTLFEDCYFVDMQSNPNHANCYGSVTRRLTVSHPGGGGRDYFAAWGVEFDNCSSCLCSGGVMTSPRFKPALETFGSQHCVFEHWTLQNGVYSSNCGDNTLAFDIQQTHTAGSMYPANGAGICYNMNDNAHYNITYGGSVMNCSVTFTDYLDLASPTQGGMYMGVACAHPGCKVTNFTYTSPDAKGVWIGNAQYGTQPMAVQAGSLSILRNISCTSKASRGLSTSLGAQEVNVVLSADSILSNSIIDSVFCADPTLAALLRTTYGNTITHLLKNGFGAEW